MCEGDNWSIYFSPPLVQRYPFSSTLDSSSSLDWNFDSPGKLSVLQDSPSTDSSPFIFNIYFIFMQELILCYSLCYYLCTLFKLFLK